MRHKALGVCLTMVLVGLALLVPWSLTSVKAGEPRSGAPQSASVAGKVQAAPAGQRFAGKPGVRGATYYGFEAQAVRVTTRFDDASVVARRSVDGDIETTINDSSGRETARFKVDAVDATTTVLRYTPADGGPLHAYGDSSVRPTLDWANRQAYSLWRDRAGATLGGAGSAAGAGGSGGPGGPVGIDSLEWRGDLIRRKGSPRDDLAARPIATETEWANGMSSKSLRKAVKAHQPVKGQTVTGDVLVTHLFRGGTDIGTLNWFPSSGLLMWDLPGLTRGYIAPEHLKDFGGWPFAPDMTWLNLQAFAFQHYKTLIQSQGFVARGAVGWPGRIVQFFAPTVSANEPGCDDLHWLDGTVLRFCCDVHDLCYEKAGCTQRSWWQVWTSWTCSTCNAWVVICFLDGGGASQIGMVK